MKQAILILFMFSTISLKAQVNRSVDFSYLIIYDYNFQPNTEDKTTRASEPMYLQAGKDFSSFMSLHQYRSDSIIEEMAREAELTNRMPQMVRTDQRPQPTILYKIFLDKKSNDMHFLGRFMVHRGHYKEAIPVFNWQLHDEEKEVAGYTCKKATTSYAGRDYIAWYAPSIELRDGPFKFNGLPGLILALHDTANEHTFTANRVEKKNTRVELREWSGIYVQEFSTREEYLAFAKKMKDNPALMLQQDMIRIPEDKQKETAERIKASIAKNNNPLEKGDQE